MEGGQLSKTDQSLLEMFVNMLGSPDILQVAKTFRDIYTGPLRTVVARIGPEDRQRAKALAFQLEWRALHAALLCEQLGAGIASRSLCAVLETTAELRDVVGSSMAEAYAAEPGLQMNEYSCQERQNLPDFNGMEPVQRAVTEDVCFRMGGKRINNDGALLQGFLRIVKAGEYQLWTESLDGSRLWIDGEVVVDNDGRRHGWMGPPGAQEREGRVALCSGLHELRLEWFAHHHWEHHHVPQLVLRYQGPDSNGAKVEVPSSALRHAQEAHKDLIALFSEGKRQSVTHFLGENLAACSDQEAVLSALAYYHGSIQTLLGEATRNMRVRLVAKMMSQPEFLKSNGLRFEPISAHGDWDEVNEDALLAFLEVSQEFAAHGKPLTQPLQVLQQLYTGPPASIVWYLNSVWSADKMRGFCQEMREVTVAQPFPTHDLQEMREGQQRALWPRLADALLLWEAGFAFVDEQAKWLHADNPVVSGLARASNEHYVSSRTVDLSSLDGKDEAALSEFLLLFPKAKRLFLPRDAAQFAGKAKLLIPSLQVAHLGAMISLEQLRTLEEEYDAARELWIPAKLTAPALQELTELFPETKVVAMDGSTGVVAAAELESPGDFESPIFEMGESVSEFTVVFEFRVERHQNPEIYQVCAGQSGTGPGDFHLGWSMHWADGRASIVLRNEGNRGHGGRIMQGGACCGFNMSGPLNDGEWHRVAVVYDANSSCCTFHLDGVEESETQRWEHCNPLRLGRVTIGEQGAWTREGRRHDRRFPEGQLRNVKLYDRLVPRAILFGKETEAPDLRLFRQQHPRMQVISQGVVPIPTLRKLLQEYERDRVVNLAECRGLTKAGLAELMASFPDADKIFLADCGCTPDLSILRPPGTTGAARRDWSRRIGAERGRTTPEWKDLAAVFITRKIVEALGRSDYLASSEPDDTDEVVDLVLQLHSLGVEATDEVDKERLGLQLVKEALVDPEDVQLTLLDAAAHLFGDGRSYLSALPARQRAVLARLILSNEDGLGMQPRHASARQLEACAPADVALVEAFKFVVEQSSGPSELKRPLRHLRALFRGPLIDLVDAFHSIAEEDQWGAVREAAQETGWSALVEAFSLALRQPRTLKLKVKRQQCVTEEVVEAYEARMSSEKGAASLCVVCAGEPEYRLSTECTHYFCGTCAKLSLQAIKDAGQFPAFCPGCRADSALEGLQEPAVGRVQTPALALLERRGVIAWDFQLQFLRQHTKDAEEHFRCPGKCGEHLAACAPQYMAVAKGEHEHEGFRRMMRLGECPCGAKMCVQCRELVVTDHRGCHEHVCPPDKSKTAEDPHEAESVKAMERLGRRCPNCGIFLEMNGGCDIMMCGTEAHGRLDKALANGGCGYQFHWESGEPAHSFYIGLNGQRVEGIVGRRG